MGRIERMGVLGIAAILSASAIALIAGFGMGAHDAPASVKPDPIELATVCDSPFTAPVRAVPQADGPFYDLPRDIEQSVVCDRSNREYVLLRTEQGGIAIIPLLEEDGEQAIMPRP